MRWYKTAQISPDRHIRAWINAWSPSEWQSRRLRLHYLAFKNDSDWARSNIWPDFEIKWIYFSLMFLWGMILWNNIEKPQRHIRTNTAYLKKKKQKQKLVVVKPLQLNTNSILLMYLQPWVYMKHFSEEGSGTKGAVQWSNWPLWIIQALETNKKNVLPQV